jgi:beta-lactamase regulating signal transducer with metallopeptidase domain
MVEVAIRTTLIFVIATIVNQLLLRRASAALRHSVWMLAFASVPFAFLLPEIVPANVQVITVAAMGATTQSALTSYATDYIGLIWGTGAAMLLLRVVLSYVLFRSGRKSVGGPLTFGLIWPEIILPSSAASWQPALRTSVILHEEAHIRRRDTVAHLCTQLVCAFIWFQPLAWYAARRAANERERACDDLVLNSGISALDYAEHLLEIARESSVPETASRILLSRAGLRQF